MFVNGNQLTARLPTLLNFFITITASISTIPLNLKAYRICLNLPSANVLKILAFLILNSSLFNKQNNRLGYEKST